MKKVVIVLAISLLAIIGCTTKKDDPALVSKTDKQYIVHTERTKGFGNYDYPNLKKAEAEKLLTEKFQLELPTLYNKIQPIIEKELEGNDIKAAEPLFQLYVQPTQVVFTKITSYEKKNQPYIDTKIEFKYFFDDGKKIAKLNNQTVMLINQTDESNTLTEKLPLFVTDVGKMVNLGGLEQGLSNYDTKVQESKNFIVQQAISIADNSDEAKKEKGLLKSIQVSYDEQGVLRELYGNIADITE
ncbi:hypothetical protein DOK67_0000783 [Enterococcus sp. DIV0212c]|uniref:hypothetical protein n=1 Tax=Enterococcus sp. DIV0212c TaxID=2230867 RepID=UPI001A9AC855|nr:hypothetical protein [Enterococcus sp. DIV0212c]MBO1354987.1 hypothetical protein [Enterococcus sp. DIV0212c]